MRLCYGLFLVSLAACGSTTSYSGNPPPPPPPAPPPAPGTVFDTVFDFRFVPDTVTITSGIPVRWTNRGAQAHTVTSDSAGLFNSGTLSSGAVYDRTFSSTGTYKYHCSIHPLMHGVVIVN